MNYKLGGPVANKMTSGLSTGKKSKIDWLASAGDIEVVADAYTTGKAAIVVAGKNRDATRSREASTFFIFLMLVRANFIMLKTSLL